MNCRQKSKEPSFKDLSPSTLAHPVTPPPSIFTPTPIKQSPSRTPTTTKRTARKGVKATRHPSLGLKRNQHDPPTSTRQSLISTFLSSSIPCAPATSDGAASSHSKASSAVLTGTAEKELITTAPLGHCSNIFGIRPCELNHGTRASGLQHEVPEPQLPSGTCLKLGSDSHSVNNIHSHQDVCMNSDPFYHRSSATTLSINGSSHSVVPITGVVQSNPNACLFLHRPPSLEVIELSSDDDIQQLPMAAASIVTTSKHVLSSQLKQSSILSYFGEIASSQCKSARDLERLSSVTCLDMVKKGSKASTSGTITSPITSVAGFTDSDFVPCSIAELCQTPSLPKRSLSTKSGDAARCPGHATTSSPISDAMLSLKCPSIPLLNKLGATDVTPGTSSSFSSSGTDLVSGLSHRDADGSIAVFDGKVSGTGGGSRPCPFYKWIRGTTFTVDAFCYGTISGCSFYFLSHFHYDHYRGLSRSFRQRLVTSRVTANMVRSQLHVDPAFITALSIGETKDIEGIHVTLLDANHCPGSVMFLFQWMDGSSILHTGDFRATDNLIQTLPRSLRVTYVYLDTTYCNPCYKFPPQEETIKLTVHIAQTARRKNHRVLIVVGAYTIGKERIFHAVAESLGTLIFCTPEKRKVLKALEDVALQRLLTEDWKKAAVHVVPMSTISFKALQSYLHQHRGSFDEVVAFRPTGWTETDRLHHDSLDIVPRRQGKIAIYGVPYSEHSSFSELELFVRAVRPTKIVPTVHIGSAESRGSMERFFKAWLASPA